MNFLKEIEQSISESIAVKRQLLAENYLSLIHKISDTIFQSLSKGKKLLICGNGGSAADSQHTAAELVNRFKINRKPIAALALTTDTSILTSVANDFDYCEVFKKQIEALGKKGDVLLAISTSGKSKSVVEAANAARKMSIKVIGFTGSDASPLSEISDLTLRVPSREVARIQESHLLTIHIICDLIEQRLSRKTNAKK
jgi:D-sedoheptulose 7-phosphate isomerase